MVLLAVQFSTAQYRLRNPGTNLKGVVEAAGRFSGAFQALQPLADLLILLRSSRAVGNLRRGDGAAVDEWRGLAGALDLCCGPAVALDLSPLCCLGALQRMHATEYGRWVCILNFIFRILLLFLGSAVHACSMMLAPAVHDAHSDSHTPKPISSARTCQTSAVCSIFCSAEHALSRAVGEGTAHDKEGCEGGA